MTGRHLSHVGHGGHGLRDPLIALVQISENAGLLPLAANQLTGALLTLGVVLSLRQPWRPRRGVVGWGSASGVLGASGTLAFMVATGTTSLGIAAVFASLYPAVTVMLAATVLRERVDTGQRTGIGVCILAVATLALALTRHHYQRERNGMQVGNLRLMDDQRPRCAALARQTTLTNRPVAGGKRVNDTKAQTTKGKVLWHFAMSLDAVVAGSNHETDWMAGTNRAGPRGSKSQSEGVPC